MQKAFFNGSGFESWENVWGIWNGITPRDAEALRRVSAIERQHKNLLMAPSIDRSGTVGFRCVKDMEPQGG